MGRAGNDVLRGRDGDDDFEGNEKGVINFHHLVNQNVLSRKSHCLIYPIQNEILKDHGFSEQSTSAVLLPLELLRVTSQ